MLPTGDLSSTHVVEAGVAFPPDTATDQLGARGATSPQEHSFPKLKAAVTAKATVNKCYIDTRQGGSETVSVCMFDYDRRGALINCTDTNHLGFYHIPTPMHTRVFLKVAWRSHTFKLDAENIHGSLLANLIDSQGNAVHVISVPDSHEQLRRVDFQDVTGQFMRVGVHGTKCRFNVANEAIFSVQIPRTLYHCEPRNDLEVVVPVSTMPFARVLLPAHPMNLTLDALEPHWPQVSFTAHDVDLLWVLICCGVLRYLQAAEHAICPCNHIVKIEAFQISATRSSTI